MATVGDSVCGAFLMLNKFNSEKTKSDMTKEKVVLKNRNLISISKSLFKDSGLPFAKNNDLLNSDETSAPEPKLNKKGYATAFEAVVGFLALLDKKYGSNHAYRIFNRFLMQ